MKIHRRIATGVLVLGLAGAGAACGVGPVPETSPTSCPEARRVVESFAAEMMLFPPSPGWRETAWDGYFAPRIERFRADFEAAAQACPALAVP